MAHFWAYREVYGADPPDFVLYEDGTVIYYRLSDLTNRYSGRFLSAKLTPREVAGIMEKLNPKIFETFENSYRAKAVASHLPYRFMVLRRPDGSYKKVTVSGFLRDSGLESGNERAVENAPEELLQAIEFVERYENFESKEWVPEYFELIIWPATEKTDKTLDWPKKWPNLNSPQTVKHKGCERYSMLIHKSDKKELSNFLYKAWKPNTAIKIGGRNWEVEIHIPFPSEATWLDIGQFKIRECS